MFWIFVTIGIGIFIYAVYVVCGACEAIGKGLGKLFPHKWYSQRVVK